MIKYMNKKAKRGYKLEEIEGILSEIIYQNEINSYIVGVLQTETEEITIVGYLPLKEGGKNSGNSNSSSSSIDSNIFSYI